LQERSIWATCKASFLTFPFPTMKFSKILGAFAVLVVALAACTTQPSGEKFGFKTGDYTVYQTVTLDSANNAIRDSVFRVTSTVIGTGLSVGGQNDAVLIIDSTFAAGSTTRLTSRDSSYFRVANDEIYWYFNTGAIGQFLGGSGSFNLAGVGLSGFQPQWVKLGDLKDAASSQDFATTAFNATINVQPVGSIAIAATIGGKGLGKTSLSLNNSTYSVHRQSQTIGLKLTIPLLGNLTIPTIQAEYDYGVPSENSTPRTLLRRQFNTVSLNVPLIGSTVFNGERRTLVSFTPGK
jgi:hypothetical protein